MTNLKLLRISLGLTQAQMALQLNCNPSSVSRMEGGWKPRDADSIAPIEAGIQALLGSDWNLSRLLEEAPSVTQLFV